MTIHLSRDEAPVTFDRSLQTLSQSTLAADRPDDFPTHHALESARWGVEAPSGRSGSLRSRSRWASAVGADPDVGALSLPTRPDYQRYTQRVPHRVTTGEGQPAAAARARRYVDARSFGSGTAPTDPDPGIGRRCDRDIDRDAGADDEPLRGEQPARLSDC
jgi:hypothetical protein